MIQFLREKKRYFILCGYYQGKLNFLKFILKLRVSCEEILNLDDLLAVAHLNRLKYSARPLIRYIADKRCEISAFHSK